MSALYAIVLVCVIAHGAEPPLCVSHSWPGLEEKTVTSSMCQTERVVRITPRENDDTRPIYYIPVNQLSFYRATGGVIGEAACREYYLRADNWVCSIAFFNVFGYMNCCNTAPIFVSSFNERLKIAYYIECWFFSGIYKSDGYVYALPDSRRATNETSGNRPYPRPLFGTHLFQLPIKYPSRTDRGSSSGQGEYRGQPQYYYCYLLALGAMTLIGLAVAAVGVYGICYSGNERLVTGTVCFIAGGAIAVVAFPSFLAVITLYGIGNTSPLFWGIGSFGLRSPCERAIERFFPRLWKWAEPTFTPARRRIFFIWIAIAAFLYANFRAWDEERSKHAVLLLEPAKLYLRNVPVAVAEQITSEPQNNRIIFGILTAEQELDSVALYDFRDWKLLCAPNSPVSVMTFGAFTRMTYQNVRCSIQGLR